MAQIELLLTPLEQVLEETTKTRVRVRKPADTSVTAE